MPRVGKTGKATKEAKTTPPPTTTTPDPSPSQAPQTTTSPPTTTTTPPPTTTTTPPSQPSDQPAEISQPESAPTPPPTTVRSNIIKGATPEEQARADDIIKQQRFTEFVNYEQQKMFWDMRQASSAREALDIRETAMAKNPLVGSYATEWSPESPKGKKVGGILGAPQFIPQEEPTPVDVGFMPAGADPAQIYPWAEERAQPVVDPDVPEGMQRSYIYTTDNEGKEIKLFSDMTYVPALGGVRIKKETKIETGSFSRVTPPEPTAPIQPDRPTSDTIPPEPTGEIYAGVPGFGSAAMVQPVVLKKLADQQGLEKIWGNLTGYVLNPFVSFLTTPPTGVEKPTGKVGSISQLQMAPWMAAVPPGLEGGLNIMRDGFTDIPADEHEFIGTGEKIGTGIMADGANLYREDAEGNKILVPDSEDYRITGSWWEQLFKGGQSPIKNVELILRDVAEHGGDMASYDNPYVDTILDQVIHVYTHPFESKAYADARQRAVDEGSLKDGDLIGSFAHMMGWSVDSWDKKDGWKSQVEQQHDMRWTGVGEAFEKAPLYYTGSLITEAALMIAPIKPAWYVAQGARIGLKVAVKAGYKTVRSVTKSPLARTDQGVIGRIGLEMTIDKQGKPVIDLGKQTNVSKQHAGIVSREADLKKLEKRLKDDYVSEDELQRMPWEAKLSEAEEAALRSKIKKQDNVKMQNLKDKIKSTQDQITKLKRDELIDERKAQPTMPSGPLTDAKIFSPQKLRGKVRDIFQLDGVTYASEQPLLETVASGGRGSPAFGKGLWFRKLIRTDEAKLDELGIPKPMLERTGISPIRQEQVVQAFGRWFEKQVRPTDFAFGEYAQASYWSKVDLDVPMPVDKLGHALGAETKIKPRYQFPSTEKTLIPSAEAKPNLLKFDDPIIKVETGRAKAFEPSTEGYRAPVRPDEIGLTGYEVKTSGMIINTGRKPTLPKGTGKKQAVSKDTAGNLVGDEVPQPSPYEQLFAGAPFKWKFPPQAGGFDSQALREIAEFGTGTPQPRPNLPGGKSYEPFTGSIPGEGVGGGGKVLPRKDIPSPFDSTTTVTEKVQGVVKTWVEPVMKKRTIFGKEVGGEVVDYYLYHADVYRPTFKGSGIARSEEPVRSPTFKVSTDKYTPEQLKKFLSGVDEKHLAETFDEGVLIPNKWTGTMEKVVKVEKGKGYKDGDKLRYSWTGAFRLWGGGKYSVVKGIVEYQSRRRQKMRIQSWGGKIGTIKPTGRVDPITGELTQTGPLMSIRSGLRQSDFQVTTFKMLVKGEPLPSTQKVLMGSSKSYYAGEMIRYGFAPIGTSQLGKGDVSVPMPRLVQLVAREGGLPNVLSKDQYGSIMIRELDGSETGLEKWAKDHDISYKVISDILRGDGSKEPFYKTPNPDYVQRNLYLGATEKQLKEFGLPDDPNWAAGPRILGDPDEFAATGRHISKPFWQLPVKKEYVDLGLDPSIKWEFPSSRRQLGAMMDEPIFPRTDKIQTSTTKGYGKKGQLEQTQTLLFKKELQLYTRNVFDPSKLFINVVIKTKTERPKGFIGPIQGTETRPMFDWREIEKLPEGVKYLKFMYGEGFEPKYLPERIPHTYKDKAGITQTAYRFNPDGSRGDKILLEPKWKKDLRVKGEAFPEYTPEFKQMFTQWQRYTRRSGTEGVEQRRKDAFFEVPDQLGQDKEGLVKFLRWMQIAPTITTGGTTKGVFKSSKGTISGGLRKSRLSIYHEQKGVMNFRTSLPSAENPWSKGMAFGQKYNEVENLANIQDSMRVAIKERNDILAEQVDMQRTGMSSDLEVYAKGEAYRAAAKEVEKLEKRFYIGSADYARQRSAQLKVEMGFIDPAAVKWPFTPERSERFVDRLGRGMFDDTQFVKSDDDSYGGIKFDDDFPPPPDDFTFGSGAKIDPEQAKVLQAELVDSQARLKEVSRLLAKLKTEEGETTPEILDSERGFLGSESKLNRALYDIYGDDKDDPFGYIVGSKTDELEKKILEAESPKTDEVYEKMIADLDKVIELRANQTVSKLLKDLATVISTKKTKSTKKPKTFAQSIASLPDDELDLLKGYISQYTFKTSPTKPFVEGKTPKIITTTTTTSKGTQVTQAQLDAFLKKPVATLSIDPGYVAFAEKTLGSGSDFVTVKQWIKHVKKTSPAFVSGRLGSGTKYAEGDFGSGFKYHLKANSPEELTELLYRLTQLDGGFLTKYPELGFKLGLPGGAQQGKAITVYIPRSLIQDTKKFAQMQRELLEVTEGMKTSGKDVGSQYTVPDYKLSDVVYYRYAGSDTSSSPTKSLWGPEEVKYLEYDDTSKPPGYRDLVAEATGRPQLLQAINKIWDMNYVEAFSLGQKVGKDSTTGVRFDWSKKAIDAELTRTKNTLSKLQASTWEQADQSLYAGKADWVMGVANQKSRLIATADKLQEGMSSLFPRTKTTTKKTESIDTSFEFALPSETSSPAKDLLSLAERFSTTKKIYVPEGLRSTFGESVVTREDVYQKFFTGTRIKLDGDTNKFISGVFGDGDISSNILGYVSYKQQKKPVLSFIDDQAFKAVKISTAEQEGKVDVVRRLGGDVRTAIERRALLRENKQKRFELQSLVDTDEMDSQTWATKFEGDEGRLDQDYGEWVTMSAEKTKSAEEALSEALDVLDPETAMRKLSTADKKRLDKLADDAVKAKGKKQAKAEAEYEALYIQKLREASKAKSESEQTQLPSGVDKGGKPARVEQPLLEAPAIDSLEVDFKVKFRQKLQRAEMVEGTGKKQGEKVPLFTQRYWEMFEVDGKLVTGKKKKGKVGDKVFYDEDSAYEGFGRDRMLKKLYTTDQKFIKLVESWLDKDVKLPVVKARKKGKAPSYWVRVGEETTTIAKVLEAQIPTKSKKGVFVAGPKGIQPDMVGKLFGDKGTQFEGMMNPEIVAMFKQIKFELPETRTAAQISDAGDVVIKQTGGPLIKPVKTATPDEKAFVLDPSIVNDQVGIPVVKKTRKVDGVTIETGEVTMIRSDTYKKSTPSSYQEKEFAWMELGEEQPSAKWLDTDPSAIEKGAGDKYPEPVNLQPIPEPSKIKPTKQQQAQIDSRMRFTVLQRVLGGRILKDKAGKPFGKTTYAEFMKKRSGSQSPRYWKYSALISGNEYKQFLKQLNKKQKPTKATSDELSNAARLILTSAKAPDFKIKGRHQGTIDKLMNMWNKHQTEWAEEQGKRDTYRNTLVEYTKETDPVRAERLAEEAKKHKSELHAFLSGAGYTKGTGKKVKIVLDQLPIDPKTGKYPTEWREIDMPGSLFDDDDWFFGKSIVEKAEVRKIIIDHQKKYLEGFERNLKPEVSKLEGELARYQSAQDQFAGVYEGTGTDQKLTKGFQLSNWGQVIVPNVETVYVIPYTPIKRKEKALFQYATGQKTKKELAMSNVDGAYLPETDLLYKQMVSTTYSVDIKGYGTIAGGDYAFSSDPEIWRGITSKKGKETRDVYDMDQPTPRKKIGRETKEVDRTEMYAGSYRVPLVTNMRDIIKGVLTKGERGAPYREYVREYFRKLYGGETKTGATSADTAGLTPPKQYQAWLQRKMLSTEGRIAKSRLPGSEINPVERQITEIRLKLDRHESGVEKLPLKEKDNLEKELIQLQKEFEAIKGEGTDALTTGYTKAIEGLPTFEDSSGKRITTNYKPFKIDPEGDGTGSMTSDQAMAELQNKISSDYKGDVRLDAGSYKTPSPQTTYLYPGQSAGQYVDDITGISNIKWTTDAQGQYWSITSDRMFSQSVPFSTPKWWQTQESGTPELTPAAISNEIQIPAVDTPAWLPFVPTQPSVVDKPFTIEISDIALRGDTIQSTRQMPLLRMDTQPIGSLATPERVVEIIRQTPRLDSGLRSRQIQITGFKPVQDYQFPDLVRPRPRMIIPVFPPIFALPPGSRRRPRKLKSKKKRKKKIWWDVPDAPFKPFSPKEYRVFTGAEPGYVKVMEKARFGQWGVGQGWLDPKKGKRDPGPMGE